MDSLEAAVELHRRFPSFNFLSPEGHAVHASGLVTVEGAGDAHRDGLLDPFDGGTLQRGPVGAQQHPHPCRGS